MDKIKILIVDDEILIQNVLTDFFEENLSCSIATASNGLEGMQQVQNSKFDLLILDWKMPILDGAAMLTALKEQEDLPATTKVILFSGYIEEAQHQMAAFSDIHFLDKAQFQSTILDLIRKILPEKFEA